MKKKLPSMVLTHGTTIDDVAMEFERAANSGRKDAGKLLMDAARAGLDLTYVVQGRTLLRTRGACAWVDVLESNVPIKLAPKKIINQLMDWLIDRIQAGQGDRGIDTVIARGLKAIDRRKPGLGQELATEILEWAIDLWDGIGRDEQNVLAVAKSVVDAMIEAGADINGPIITPRSKRFRAHNLLDVLVKKDAKDGNSGEQNPMIGHLIGRGANWEVVYYDSNTPESVKEILRQFPIVRRAALTDQVVDTVRPQSGVRRKI